MIQVQEIVSQAATERSAHTNIADTAGSIAPLSAIRHELLIFSG